MSKQYHRKLANKFRRKAIRSGDSAAAFIAALREKEAREAARITSEGKMSEKPQKCWVCNGKGIDYDETCLTCGGKGVVNQSGGYHDEDKWNNVQDRYHRRFKKTVKEDASGVSGSDGVPANNVGGGKVAGLGIGSQGEPSVKTSMQKKKKQLRDIISTKRMEVGS